MGPLRSIRIKRTIQVSLRLLLPGSRYLRQLFIGLAALLDDREPPCKGLFGLHRDPHGLTPKRVSLDVDIRPVIVLLTQHDFSFSEISGIFGFRVGWEILVAEDTISNLCMPLDPVGSPFKDDRAFNS